MHCSNGRRLFDHLVGNGEQCRRDGEADRSRAVEVDHQLELGRLHNRQVRRLRALEDTRGIESDLANGVEDVASVADQPAGFGIGADRIDRRKRVARRQNGKLDAPGVEERAWTDKQSVGLLARHAREGRINVVPG
jgi:hypothetical protein